jgi:antitoxin ParD1/3/4/toxin ParE1/3/4
LLEIWHFIARESVQSASRVTDTIEAEIRELATMPGKGHTRSDVRDDRYRFWSVFSWVIAYRYDEKTLTVARVVHGHRNFRKLFK